VAGRHLPKQRSGKLAAVKVLLTEQEIREGVGRMARQISQRYVQRPLTIIGVLTGSVVLLADLIRLLDLPLRVGVVQASSYRGEVTRGPVVVNSELMPDIARRDVLLIDDIFDTGHTLVEVIDLMDAMGPKSIRSAVLLRKRGRQQVSLAPDFVGFDIPDEFVVGYGLDYHDAYRNLPYVAALEPEELSGDPV
jgi:hypoxanthine phosphoribosyltransferase